MKHVPATALVPVARHARLFELIRQENLLAERAKGADRRDQNAIVADYLQKAATASLKIRR